MEGFVLSKKFGADYNQIHNFMYKLVDNKIINEITDTSIDILLYTWRVTAAARASWSRASAILCWLFLQSKISEWILNFYNALGSESWETIITE